MSGDLAPIAVLRSGALGDFILTLPAIAALRAARPGAPLWVIGRPDRAALARPDAILDAGGPALTPLFTPDGPNGPSPALQGLSLTLGYTAGANPKLAARLERMTGGEVWLADPRPPADLAVHMTEHLLQPLRQRHAPVLSTAPSVSLNHGDFAYADRLLAPFDARSGPLVCVHPGSGGAGKCWPAPAYAELIGQLAGAGIRCVAILGPVEEERSPGLAAAVAANAAVARPPDPMALAGVLARADLFVGNDSGPGHLAAAVGTPTLSLFGPTDPRLWAPAGDRGRVLRAPGGNLSRLDCSGVARAARDLLESAG